MRKARVKWLKKIHKEFGGLDETFNKLKKSYNELGYEKFLVVVELFRERKANSEGRRRFEESNRPSG